MSSRNFDWLFVAAGASLCSGDSGGTAGAAPREPLTVGIAAWKKAAGARKGGPERDTLLCSHTEWTWGTVS